MLSRTLDPPSQKMLDFAWLLSACPDLARAERLIIVHGEGPDK